MATGIKIYNPDGSLQFDCTNRLFRTLVVQETGGAAGSATVQGANGQGSVVAAATLVSESDDGLPAVSVAGNTVSWGNGPNARINIMVF